MIFKKLFRHLSCVPKKCDRKKGTQLKISFSAGSVVLGTFRKLADRIIFVHQSLALRERDRVRVGLFLGSDSPKCLTLGLGRLAKFSHGNHARTFASYHRCFLDKFASFLFTQYIML
jgi:hypothetical protein